MLIRSNYLLYTRSSAVLAFAFLTNIDPARAAVADDEQDIVVSATKRGNSTVQDIPITIQAIGGDSLERRGATEFNDFVKLVPGLSSWDQGPGNKRYVLRGISSGGAGTVGVYLDEIVLTGENSQSGGGLQADPKLFDIDRVEILKGPQGTTFGSSALSGVIRYIINKPDLEKFGGTIRAAATSQRHAGVGGNFDMTVNVPVVTDTLALRGSVFLKGSPGYIENRFKKGVNDEQTLASRLQSRLKIGEDVTFDLLWQHQETDAGLNFYNLTTETRVPVAKYFQSALERLSFSDNQDLFNATMNYDVGIGTVTATASHTDRVITFNRPASAVLAAAARVPVTNVNTRSVLSNPRRNKVQAYELRFSSKWDSSVQILTGLYYQKDDRNFASRIPTVDANGRVDGVGGIYGSLLQDRSLLTKIEEKAVFGEVTWDITDKLQVIGGARAFKFNNESQGNARLGVLGRPGTGFGPVSKSAESSAIGRGIISYNFTRDTKLYGQVAQGYRPGGTNDQAAAALGGTTVPSGFKSDKLINYEAGLKHTSSDRRFSFTIAGYYIDWTDIQLGLRTAVGASGTQYAYTGNAGAARVYGGEVEATLRPVRGLTLGVSGSYTNATIQEAVVGGGAKGDTIPYTPKWSGALSADYEFPLFSETGFVGGDVSYTGKRVTDFTTNALFYQELDETVTANIRFGMQFETVRVSIIGRNILDDDTVTDVFFQQPPTTLNGYFRNPPRSISVEVGFKF